MNRSIACLALLLLTSCSAIRNSDSTVSTPTATPAIADLPDVQCQGEMPEPVATSVQGYRLAQEADFVPAIRNFNPDYTTEDFTCSIFAADFDEDGDRDYALLLIDEETSNFQTQLSLNQGNGEFESRLLKDYERVTEPSEGVVYTSLSFKPAGSRGLDTREYSPLEPEEAEIYVSKPSISTWRAINTNEAGLPKDVSDLSGLAYCSEGFYFVEGELRQVEVCD